MTSELHHRSLVACAIGALAALSAASALPAQGAECAPIYASQLKLLKTPHHGYSVDSSAVGARLHQGQATTSESIMTGEAIYTLYKGSWRRSPASVEDMQKQEEENIKNAKSTCAVAGMESVNGEAATVYQVHSVTDFGTSDARQWVSKSRGLPLRTVMRLDAGGAMGKSIMVMHYDYSNVAAPAGVQ